MQGSYLAGWPFHSRAWLLLNHVGGVEISKDISHVLLCSASYIPSTFLQQTLSVCHTRHFQALQAQHGTEQQKPCPRGVHHLGGGEGVWPTLKVKCGGG